MSVARLVTSVSLRELTATTYSVTLRHVACLGDGREILLLDDRGFGGRTDAPRIALSRDGLERDARMCVGPDEPVDGETWEQAEAEHWQSLVARLREAGVTIGADQLRRLEHDVVLDERLEAAVA